jgi:alkylation response protein AidB-like acyl-CoA dehydrogenase
MTTTMTRNPISYTATPQLSAEMLEGFRGRAGDLDRTNAYFAEDLAELRSHGYLAAAVPTHLGGWGLSLASGGQPAASGAGAPATAGDEHALLLDRDATELEKAGDTSLRWILEAAVAGEVFAAGHAESGNDIPVLLSTCAAERVEGGYRLTGRKQFGSNGPAWRWLGAHAIDADAPGGPQIVHGFVERSSPGVAVVETWDTSACVRPRATTRSSTGCSSPTPASGGSYRPVTAPTCSWSPWRSGRCR